MSRRKRKKIPPQSPVCVEVESLSHEGRGIAHVQDKVVFIDGALPGEQVEFRYLASHRNYDEGVVQQVLSASPDRVTARCPYFTLCGGCSLQHLRGERQIEYKQQLLLDQLRHTGKVEPSEVVPPLTGPAWGYRTKARLGVRYVEKKDRVLVGFREKHSAYLADMLSCEVLDPRVGQALTAIAECVQSLQSCRKIAQIEVAATEENVALVFRNLVPLPKTDQDRLAQFAEGRGFHIYLQPGGEDSVHLLYPEQSVLSYTLPEQALSLQFHATDFTQINPAINRAMIAQALDWLQLQKQERVLDLFCGIGNFSLPMARYAGHVTGVEGDARLIERARANARRNALESVEFYVSDLTADLRDASWSRQTYDKILLDPPRTGALEILPLVAGFGAQHIVYVSCNPATLARDAAELVHRHGYRLQSCGVMDMFPHTSHVETMALFVRGR